MRILSGRAGKNANSGKEHAGAAHKTDGVRRNAVHGTDSPSPCPLPRWGEGIILASFGSGERCVRDELLMYLSSASLTFVCCSGRSRAYQTHKTAMIRPASADR